MNILIPNRAVILIYGPSCSGKSTLAEKIMTESPSKSKAIHSGDTALHEIYMTHPELAPYSLISLGLLQSPEKPPAMMLRMQKEISQLMTEKVELLFRRYDLVIMDEVRQKCETLSRNLPILHNMAGRRAIVLIKMSPSTEVYRIFCEKRRNNNRLTMNSLEEQRQAFLGIAQHDYSADYDFVTEYTVSDPREISLEFF